MIGGISGYCHLVRLALYSRPRVVFEQSGGQESWLKRGQRRRPARRLYLRVHESTRPTERTHHLVRSIIVRMIAMPAGAGDKVRSSTFPSPPTSDDSRESDNVLLAIASAEVPPKRGGKRNAINTNTVPFYYAKSCVIRCVRGNKEMAKGVARGGGKGVELEGSGLTISDFSAPSPPAACCDCVRSRYGWYLPRPVWRVLTRSLEATHPHRWSLRLAPLQRSLAANPTLRIPVHLVPDEHKGKTVWVRRGRLSEGKESETERHDRIFMIRVCQIG